MFLFGVVVRDLRQQGGGPSELTYLGPQMLSSDISACAEQHFPDASPLPSAFDIFVSSLNLSPWNWSCWLELAAICVSEKRSPPSWATICQQRDLTVSAVNSDRVLMMDAALVMHDCFLCQLHLDLQLGDEVLRLAPRLLHCFPTSQIVSSYIALAHYCLRDYEQSQEAFEAIRVADPHRVENMDTFSNILYVKERRADLSHLAHNITKINKFAPESCCVVGNYYSLKGSHEKAILHFTRAIKCNPAYLTAWTLMGHEYVELRNTAAAVQCYRRAVQVSPADYRAWYGLGQTYEMLHLFQYALYYYKKACFLKPQDARMWCAVGSCLAKLGQPRDAILSYERAVGCGDREGVAARELARQYREAGMTDKAAACFLRLVQERSSQVPGSTGIDPELAEAHLFLAVYYRAADNRELAEQHCVELVDAQGAEGDEARALLREMRSLGRDGGGRAEDESWAGRSMARGEALSMTVDGDDD